MRPVRISKKAQALPTAARSKALHKSASHTYKTKAYAVPPSLRREILAWAGVSERKQQSIVDVFAQTCNAQFLSYWTQSQNAFYKDLSWDYRWINAPLSGMQDVVLKTIMDQAQGIMIVPVWKVHDRFRELGEMALDWWDMPAEQPVYQDNAGLVLPQTRGWTTRVVLFDAFSSNIRDSVSDEVAGGYECHADTGPRLQDLIEHWRPSRARATTAVKRDIGRRIAPSPRRQMTSETADLAGAPAKGKARAKARAKERAMPTPGIVGPGATANPAKGMTRLVHQA